MVSVAQIPNLPAAVALSGTEQLEVVQAGVSVRATVTQIATYVQSAYPAPGVTSIATSDPITGGTITTTGTIGLQTAGVTNLYLASMAGQRIKANVTGSPASPTDATLSSVLDIAGSTRGNILYRGASGWTVLAPGSIGYGLIVSPSTDPEWADISPVDITVTAPLTKTGAIIGLDTPLAITYGGTGQSAALTLNGVVYGASTTAQGITAAGTTGQVLVGTTGSAPSWAAATGIAVTSLAFGTTGLTPAAATQGAITVAGTLVAANGGTGFASYAVGDILYANTTTTLAKLPDVATGSVLVSGGVGVAPAWSAATGVAVTSLSFGTTGLTPSSPTQGAIVVAGTLVAGNGGTGISSYAIGDILYASASGTLSKLADVATGNALISGGVTTAPSWGKIGLTTHVSGTLPVGNGGTGQSSNWTQYGVVYASTTAVLANTAAGTTGQFLGANTGGAPTWQTPAGGVTTISFGTTGLTPNSATSGAVTVAGTLIAANGGTGFASYAVGDLLSADTTTTLSKVAAVATGRVLISQGTGTLPVWSTSPTVSQIGLNGSSSGTLTVKAAAAAGTTTLTLPGGTTDFSATGGTSQVVKQTSSGGAFTVAQLSNSDISGLGTAATQNTGTSGANVPLLNGNNTQSGTLTCSSTLNVSGGDLEVKAQQIQSFTTLEANVSGTLKHQMYTDNTNQVLGNFCGKITGASASQNTTPTVGVGTNFTAGAGITGNCFVYNTAAQVAVDFLVLGAWLESTVNLASNPILQPCFVSRNINGTTRVRAEVDFYLATTGGVWNINTTNIPSGDQVAWRLGIMLA